MSPASTSAPIANPPYRFCNLQFDTAPSSSGPELSRRLGLSALLWYSTSSNFASESFRLEIYFQGDYYYWWWSFYDFVVRCSIHRCFLRRDYIWTFSTKCSTSCLCYSSMTPPCHPGRSTHVPLFQTIFVDSLSMVLGWSC